MTWVRIDDSFAQNPKVVSAGPLAMALQVAALCYCNRNLTDGFVPRPVARTLLDWEIVDSSGTIHTLAITSGLSGNDVTSAFVISLLLDCGMWIEEDKGYRIHDYLQYQPSSQNVKEQREKTKTRVDQWRKHQKDKIGNAECNGVTNDVGNVGVTPAPVPVPIKKENPHPPKGCASRFEEFWTAYPHRGKLPDPKKPALEKFERKVRDGIDPETIIEGAKRYADLVRSEMIEDRFVTTALVWLNQERWEAAKVEEPITAEEQAALDAARKGKPVIRVVAENLSADDDMPDIPEFLRRA
jgi:hypothetical protein